MFKEQYIRDNDKLKAKETLLMEIKEKNTREKIALTPRQKFVRYGAVFAAFILVAAGVFGTLYATRGNNSATPANATLSATTENATSATDGTPATAAITEVTSYDDIYGLIESMQTKYGMSGGGVMMEAATTDTAAAAAPAAD